MTVQETETMPAGREIDALVAGKMMGLHFAFGLELETGRIDARGQRTTVPLLKYCTDIASALQVAQKLRMTVYCPGSSYALGAHKNSGYAANDEARFMAETLDGVASHAETAPLAVCRAALKAMMKPS